jgi:hypothetical protein
MQQSQAAVTEQPVCDTAIPKTKAAHFFMSAHTPSGFISHFDRLYDASAGWRAYILKSAPGVAAPLLTKAGAQLESAGITVEYIHCVCEPGGAAALVLPQLKICVADGMPPHCVEPEFPGVVEDEVMLFAPDGEKLLSQRERILQFAARASALYDRAYRFLSAAVSLQSDTFRIAAESLDAEAVEKYASNLAKRLFTPCGGVGTDTPRYLSGLTADGIAFFYDAVAVSYMRIFAIEDEYGAGGLLLSLLREKAVAAGHNVISCGCSMSQRPEHLLIPSLSIAFITSNGYHRAEGKACRHINIKRFMDCDSLRLKKARIGFNRRASRELYNQAVSLLAEAKANDGIVRECYEPCIDLPCAQKKVDALVRIIIGKSPVQ